MTKSVTASSSMNPIEMDSFINKQVNEMLDHIKVCILVLYMYMLLCINICLNSINQCILYLLLYM